MWPIALLTVFHELSSGCALRPEIGPMYGERAVSETQLACQGLAKLPPHSIVMGDRGFGIFGVAYEAKRWGRDFLFRMKKSNFESLRRKADFKRPTDLPNSRQLPKPTIGIRRGVGSIRSSVARQSRLVVTSPQLVPEALHGSRSSDEAIPRDAISHIGLRRVRRTSLNLLIVLT